jgi:hypothetical protein
MRPLTCRAVRRRVQALHDRELSVGEQIALCAHLDWCGECAAALAELERVGTALRAGAFGQGRLTLDEEGSFTAPVVGRLKAEQEASWAARLQLMFEDLHLVYAGLGAAAATLACLVVMLGMMRFATIERPDSLAALVKFLAAPAPSLHPVPVGGRALGSAAMAASRDDSAEMDAVFTLAAVVTREGRIANLERLRAGGGRAAARDAKLVEGLLDAVARAPFEPAQVGGPSGAVNVAWVVPRSTTPVNRSQPIDLAAPPAGKKRAALWTDQGPQLLRG